MANYQTKKQEVEVIKTNLNFYYDLDKLCLNEFTNLAQFKRLDTLRGIERWINHFRNRRNYTITLDLLNVDIIYPHEFYIKLIKLLTGYNTNCGIQSLNKEYGFYSFISITLNSKIESLHLYKNILSISKSYDFEDLKFRVYGRS